MRPARHRFMGPPYLVPAAWSRAVVERVRGCLYCGTTMAADVPVVVDVVHDERERRPDHLVVERFVDGAPEVANVALGSARHLLDQRVTNHLAVAALDSRLVVIAEMYGGRYVVVVIDAQRGRVTGARRLAVSAVGEDHAYREHQASIAASTDGFGVAFGTSDAIVWVGLDSDGVAEGPVHVTHGFHDTRPEVVWTGSSFVVLTERTIESSSHYRRIDVPQLWVVDDGHLTRLGSLGTELEGLELGSWLVAGPPLAIAGDVYLAAEAFTASVREHLDSPYRLYRIASDGTVENRPCALIDEE